MRGAHSRGRRPISRSTRSLTAELDAGQRRVTYTHLAAGVDAAADRPQHRPRRSRCVTSATSAGATTRPTATRSAASPAARSARARAVTIEAGALATRTRVDGDGGGLAGALQQDDAISSQIYSVYAGPSVQSRKRRVAGRRPLSLRLHQGRIARRGRRRRRAAPAGRRVRREHDPFGRRSRRRRRRTPSCRSASASAAGW